MVIGMTERTNASPSDWLSPADAARCLGVTTTHLARLADRGQIRFMRREGGHRRYLAADVEAILAREPWEPGHATA